MLSIVRDVRFIISSFACPTLDPVSSHHSFHPLIRWVITTLLPAGAFGHPGSASVWYDQCPATDHTSKQTQFNASLQVVYSSIVRLVTRHWSWSYNECDAWQDLSSANCQHHLVNATVEQSDTTETPPMKRSKLYSFMNDPYPSDTTAPQSDILHNELHYTVHPGAEPSTPVLGSACRYSATAYTTPATPSRCTSWWCCRRAPLQRGGKFFRPERCRLSDKTFEALMCIKNNGYLLKQ